MIALDVRTVVSLSVVSYLVCTLFIVQLWRQNRGRFAGMDLWIFHFALQAAALVLIILRGAIPDWASIFLANVLIFSGALLIYLGLERFVDKPGKHLHDYVLLAACTLGYWFHSVIAPDLRMRTFIFLIYSFIITLEVVRLLWRRVAPTMRPLTFGVGLVFAGYCAISVVRFAEFLFGSGTGNDFFASDGFQSLILVCYQTLTIMLTYSLVLMVNKRLISNVETEKEKFARAFHAAPYSITLTDLPSGTMLDVNETFESVSGYSRAEVIGRNTLDLHLWEHAKDRDAVIEALLRTGEVATMEQHFRRKDGQAIVGLVSAQVLLIDGKECILSCIADVSERKEAEVALQRESAALRQRNEELDRFNRLAVGREMEMIALKQQVNALSHQLGQAAPYALAFVEAPQGTAESRAMEISGTSR